VTIIIIIMINMIIIIVCLFHTYNIPFDTGRHTVPADDSKASNKQLAKAVLVTCLLLIALVILDWIGAF
jgi:hypothetical protein